MPCFLGQSWFSSFTVYHPLTNCIHVSPVTHVIQLSVLQQVNVDTASSTPVAKKKLTVWKKLKKALFPPTKSSKREATAQRLMQGGAGVGDDAATPQRYSEKHADPSDGVVSYSRKTSFQEARENQTPYRWEASLFACLNAKLSCWLEIFF